MARPKKTLNAENAAAAARPAEESVALRQQRIQSGFAAIYAAEKSIEALVEEYLAEERAERTRLWRELKADTTITRKVLAAEYALYKIARDSRGFQKEEEGDVVLDHLREVHMALHPGETVDWIKVIQGDFSKTAAKAGKAGADPAPAPTPGVYNDAMSAVIDEGAKAGLAGDDRMSNPYEVGKDERANWDKGWRNGDKQRQVDASKKRAAVQAPEEMAGAAH